ncbi:MAG: poly(R)-hydroxyalkanoic acid synthase subunit PhaE [Deinococcales bacterium]
MNTSQEIPTAMLNMWQEAQQQLWQGFIKANPMAQAVQAASNSIGKTMKDMSSMMGEQLAEGQREALQQSMALFAKTSSEWQKMLSQNLETFNQQLGAGAFGMSQGVAGQVADQIKMAQEASMRLVQLASESMQKIMLTSNWQEGLEAYSENLRQQLGRMLEQQRSLSQSGSDFWRSYLNSIENLSAPWLSSLNGALQSQAPMNAMNPLAADGVNNLRQVSNYFYQAYQQAFMPFISSPTLGYSREYERKIRDLYTAYAELSEASNDYQLVMLDINIKAFQALMKEMTALAQKGEVIQDVNKLANIWIGVSDKVFVEEFYSERYIDAQGKFLNANMKLKLQNRVVMEGMLKALDMPTRTELDESYQVISELRRELRALQREVKSLKAPSPKAQPQASVSPVLDGEDDDLKRIKGIGATYAKLLNEHGLKRISQIAALSDGEIDSLEANMGQRVNLRDVRAKAQALN